MHVISTIIRCFRKSYGPNVWDTNLKPRAILKDGSYNIIQPKFSRRYLHYLKDTFTSLVDAEWKWAIQVMVIGFTGSWLTFALLWWLIAFVHKDLHEDHMPAQQAQNGWTPCVLNIYGFHSCFLFSLETQSTMGYGLRVISEECPEAIFLMCAQCIIGTMIDSFTVGVIFAKFTRPTLTAYTIQFSKNALICLRDGEYCLMMRIGDLRKCRLIGVSIKAFFIQSITSTEGENLEQYETQLEIECDKTGSEPFLLWPVTAIHKIDENSPLFKLSASEMLNKKFEIVVILDGTIESTGQNTNAKTSFLENEILWGRTFHNMIFYNQEMECYESDYKFFDMIIISTMPTCSAADYKKSNKETLNATKQECKKHETLKYHHYINRPPLLKNSLLEKKSKKNEEIIVDSGAEFRSSTPPFPVDWV